MRRCEKASSAGIDGGRNSRPLIATIVSLQHPSVEKTRALVWAMYIEGRGEENRANPPNPNPPQKRICNLPRRHAARTNHRSMGRAATAAGARPSQIPG